MLDWKDEYTDQRVARTRNGGEYRVSDADSLGRREVTFTLKGVEVFIGRCFWVDDGIQMAEKHSFWLGGFTKGSPNE